MIFFYTMLFDAAIDIDDINVESIVFLILVVCETSVPIKNDQSFQCENSQFRSIGRINIAGKQGENDLSVDRYDETSETVDQLMGAMRELVKE